MTEPQGTTPREPETAPQPRATIGDATVHTDTDDAGTNDAGTPTAAVGLILVLVGIALFGAQWLDVGVDDIGWPFWIIAGGIVALLIGLVAIREQGLVVAGTIATTVGLVLLFQDRTGLWQTWAYAWALVGPAASGLGLILWGVRSRDARDVRNGTWGLLGGLAMFAVGFLFFEGVIGLSGDRLGLPEWLLPVVVIGIGVVVLGRGLLERRTA